MDAKAKENAAMADSLPQLKLTNKPTIITQPLALLVDFAQQQVLLVELEVSLAVHEENSLVISLFALQLINLLK
jgi:hypothetical protein